MKGFKNLWAEDLTQEVLFKFLHCQDCDFIWNNDYDELIFNPETYDNFTPITDVNQAEKLLAQSIYSLLPFAELSATPFFNYIEVGSGKRLGMLKELFRLHQDASFFAVDPVLNNESFCINPQISILLKTNLFDIEIPPGSFNILIFRSHYISLTKEIFLDPGV